MSPAHACDLHDQSLPAPHWVPEGGLAPLSPQLLPCLTLHESGALGEEGVTAPLPALTRRPLMLPASGQSREEPSRPNPGLNHARRGMARRAATPPPWFLPPPRSSQGAGLSRRWPDSGGICLCLGRSTTLRKIVSRFQTRPFFILKTEEDILALLDTIVVEITTLATSHSWLICEY